MAPPGGSNVLCGENVEKSCLQLLDFRIVGPKFGCIPKAKKYLFSQFQTKYSQFEIFLGFFNFISYNTNTEHVTNSQFHRIIEYNHTCFFLPFFLVHLGKFNYWNQSSIGSAMHKDHVKFPNFSQNSANFPNSMGPIAKKWCESPEGKNRLPLRLGGKGEKNRLEPQGLEP